MARKMKAPYIKSRTTDGTEKLYFQLAVPKDLHEKYGRKVIIKSLRTSNEFEALLRRDQLLKKYREEFARLRGERQLAAVEIEQFAKEVYGSTLANSDTYREDPQWLGEYATDENEAGLDLAMSLLSDDLRDEDTRSVQSELRALEKRFHVELTEEERQEIGMALMSARFFALKAASRKLGGRKPNTPDVFYPPALDEPARPLEATQGTPGGRTVTAVAAAYFEEKQRDPSAAMTEAWVKHCRATYRYFADFVGERDFASLRRDDVASFLDALGKLDRDWSRRRGATKLSFWKLLETQTSDAKIKNRTINSHKNRLSALFQFAIRRGWFTHDNPARDQSRPVGNTDQPSFKEFTADELNTLLASPLLSKPKDVRTRPNVIDEDDIMGWTFLVGLFTGARRAEILGLQVADVREVEGVPCFSFEPNKDRSLKTKRSKRLVPVHSRLIEAGLLEYRDALAAEGHDQLFPHVGDTGAFGDVVGNRFRGWRRELGVDRRTEENKGRDGLGLHSLRANVSTELENAGVPENVAARITGHTYGGSLAYSLYSGGVQVEVLQEAIEKVRYRGVDFSRLQQPNKS